MEELTQTIRNLGPTRLAIIGGVVLTLIGFLIFLTTRLSSDNMELLYSELENQDSQRIIQVLNTRKIPYELNGNGSQILVPSAEVLKLRLELANQGIPSGGAIGYEVFDDSESLGTTNFMQNVNLVRALEGELSRTIQSINSVRAARVHLVMPKRELFSRKTQEPSASIVLRMQGASRLTADQVAAVSHLVASAVPSLTPNRISIIDDKGKLLAGGFEDIDGAASFANKADERTRMIENRIADTIEELLEKTVGFGKVQAKVTATASYDRVSKQTEAYDPDGQVVRSTQTIEEQERAKDTEGTPPVSVGTNLPDPNLGGAENATAEQNRNRTEETVNYEITKTTTNEVREGGQIQRLSIAVLVDQVKSINEDGTITYEPRSDDEMNLLSSLVQGAIGFDSKRGDTLEVVQMRFADFDDLDEMEPLLFGLTKAELMQLAKYMVLAIVAILIILLVVRPLISRAFENLPSAEEAAERLLAEQAGAPALTGPELELEEEEGFDELIDIERVEGRVKASTLQQIADIIDNHPEEALFVVREWMTEDAQQQT
ncbi:MAG: Flagellar M-ring protein [Alphaproteobacteria bacterium MarineAlpha3_Bin5]|nr:flagellar M-ring protein FliF [Magnetovibrio sp.]PPR77902.1 MAG: Flagellar M-ring protein [Alphaproteobacteria bacterium MarineAlpha3_Bin5]